ncbi:hypothetical protein [Raineyella sp. W15-4]|uniref:hypothetical protein n=1 Tax=Raineyella sp. W15-4 TaxID=3081651 RepID=UPI0029548D11|nr:hypothetical protein [Raineyella sp. W15-4]WOQ17940.1 hypothetical protein R0145_04325 [Raineyella sp. W15-4]
MTTTAAIAPMRRLRRLAQPRWSPSTAREGPLPRDGGGVPAPAGVALREAVVELSAAWEGDAARAGDVADAEPAGGRCSASAAGVAGIRPVASVIGSWPVAWVAGVSPVVSYDREVGEPVLAGEPVGGVGAAAPPSPP